MSKFTLKLTLLCTAHYKHTDKDWINTQPHDQTGFMTTYFN